MTDISFAVPPGTKRGRRRGSVQPELDMPSMMRRSTIDGGHSSSDAVAQHGSPTAGLSASSAVMGQLSSPTAGLSVSSAAMPQEASPYRGLSVSSAALAPSRSTVTSHRRRTIHALGVSSIMMAQSRNGDENGSASRRSI